MKRHSPKLPRPLHLFVMGIIVWFTIAYLVAPDIWKRHEGKHPALINAPIWTTTSAGIPGDPLNLFVVGSREQLTQGMLASGWFPADPVTIESSLRIAEDSALHRAYDDAPVSSLLLFGRKQDLAFEKPVGDDPDKRHHVRFWEAPAKDSEGRVAWWGAATFDKSEGLSHTTGEITHHIAPEIDAERDMILKDLSKNGAAKISYRSGFLRVSGRNGGGDSWESDGRLGVAEMPSDR